VVKSHGGGERLGKVTAETVTGVAQRDERKRTIDEASFIRNGSMNLSRIVINGPKRAHSGLNEEVSLDLVYRYVYIC